MPEIKPIAAPAASPDLPKEESMEIKTPNGHVVEMRPPKQATQLAIGAILGNDYSQYLHMVAKALMWVAKIDGQPVALPGKRADAQALMNKIGDEGVEMVLAYWADKAAGSGVTPSVLAFARDLVQRGYLTQEQCDELVGGGSGPSPL